MAEISTIIAEKEQVIISIVSDRPNTIKALLTEYMKDFEKRYSEFEIDWTIQKNKKE